MKSQDTLSKKAAIWPVPIPPVLHKFD